MTNDRACSRRDFLGRSAGCFAHIALMSRAAPMRACRPWTVGQERYPVVASEPWGRLHRVDDGIWALVSDPLVDRTTLCNGGIIAGRAGVVVVEAFGSDAGASWMASEAQRLTGRRPTHFVVTHFHGDHTGGLGAVAGNDGPDVLATDVTRDLVIDRNGGVPADVVRGAELLDTRRPTEIDLGDRSIVVVPRRGHTDSDVSIELPEQDVVFSGDLIWNHMFPNYVDATPSRLTQSVRMMRARGATTWVPGHGPLADDAAVDRYIDLLDDVESAARRAIARGMSADEAGEAYEMPAGLQDWTLFNPGYFARAIGSWMSELGAA